MPISVEPSSRSFRYGLLAIFVVAGLWRAGMAAALPAISRDGVTFCWYARELGAQGLAYLRTPPAQQHPLFPVMILGVQRVARLLGASDSPLTWQRSGQLVCWLAGMIVVGLVGAMGVRLVRRLELPLDERLTALMAMLVVALLDLNVWLSADVMSDQVHLAFYLGAVLLLLKLDSHRTALGCGLLSGLAFLTRQEGVVPVFAGLAVLVARRRQTAGKELGARVGLLLFGFLICAGPYWALVGHFSTKKDIFERFRRETALVVPGLPDPVMTSLAARRPDAIRDSADPAVESGTAQARLETFDLPWYALLPHALYRLFRAGRVMIPLLAIFPLVRLRRHLFGPVLSGVTTCAAAHFALTVALLEHHGYLAPRHMLVIVMLLTPFAGLVLTHVLTQMVQLRRAWLGGLIVVLCLLPQATYLRRTPNAKDAFLADAARWLVAHDPDVASKYLVSAGTGRRIAFYANMSWVWWDRPERYDSFRRLMRSDESGYFAIELEAPDPGADQYEREGNRAVLEEMLGDARIGARLERIHVQPAPDQGELHVFAIHPEPSGPAK